jgi:hypothetical protein
LPALAQQHEHAAAAPAKGKAVTLMAGYGTWHHPVTTKNAQAQAFFDQGLRQIYAFNHDEAARSFQHAAELDPAMAMAYWGVAEAVGPNYNDPASDERFAQAHTAIQKALALMLPRPTRRTSPRWRNAFPVTPTPTGAPPRKLIAMPCANW